MVSRPRCLSCLWPTVGQHFMAGQEKLLTSYQPGSKERGKSEYPLLRVFSQGHLYFYQTSPSVSPLPPAHHRLVTRPPTYSPGQTFKIQTVTLFICIFLEMDLLDLENVVFGEWGVDQILPDYWWKPVYDHWCHYFCTLYHSDRYKGVIIVASTSFHDLRRLNIFHDIKQGFVEKDLFFCDLTFCIIFISCTCFIFEFWVFIQILKTL